MRRKRAARCIRLCAAARCCSAATGLRAVAWLAQRCPRGASDATLARPSMPRSASAARPSSGRACLRTCERAAPRALARSARARSHLTTAPLEPRSSRRTSGRLSLSLSPTSLTSSAKKAGHHLSASTTEEVAAPTGSGEPGGPRRGEAIARPRRAQRSTRDRASARAVQQPRWLWPRERQRVRRCRSKRRKSTGWLDGERVSGGLEPSSRPPPAARQQQQRRDAAGERERWQAPAARTMIRGGGGGGGGRKGLDSRSR